MSSAPQLSVVCTGKYRPSRIEAVIQDLRAAGIDLELIVEHGGPTDHRGERILRALRRCRGDFIAVCPEDGGLLAEGLKTALSEFQQFQHAGALLCNDLDVDIVSLLFTRYRPGITDALLRRRCLVGLGLERPDWAVDCLEFDLMQRIAATDGWQRSSAQISRKRRWSRRPIAAIDDIQHEMKARLAVVDRLFSDDGFLAGLHGSLQLECVANQFSLIREQSSRLGAAELGRVFDPWLRPLAQRLIDLGDDPAASRSLHRLVDFRQPEPRPTAWQALRRTIGRTASEPATGDPCLVLQRALALPFKPARDLPLAACRSGLADVYARVAPVYEERGQSAEAIEMWRHAQGLGDAMVDSLALQTWTKHPGVDSEDLVRLHKQWAARHVPQAKAVALAPPTPYDGRRKIRIGYHCSFMGSDTIRYMMRNVFARHDRGAFEVYGYSPIAVPGDIASSFDVLRDVAATAHDRQAVRPWQSADISDDRFVDLVRSDEIDIMVELTGFSPGHRFAALAKRCAPIQMMYFNHPCTSAVANVDYFISDGVTDPVGAEAGHLEQLIRLPHSSICCDYVGADCPPVVEPPSLRRGFITFGCFGGAQKFNIELVRLWSRVLERVPNSVLRLQNHHLSKADARRFLKARFARFGIAPERLQLKSGLDRKALLAAYGDVDISLDTWPYNGGNTTGEALWQGVPVVGLRGTSFSSRYGASMLGAAGCADLVGASFDDYVAIAADLAGDPQRLRALRHSLRGLCSKHGLNDSTRLARSLEDVFRTVMASLRPPDAPLPETALMHP